MRSIAVENPSTLIDRKSSEALIGNAPASGPIPPIQVVRIIDRLNIGGPAKHVVWLTAGMDPDRFETTLITGTIPPGEGDMSYFASAAGIEPVIIRQMSRELSPRDLLVLIKLLFILWRVKPDVVHTHKAKAGAVGRAAAFIYKWATPSALLLRPRRCVILHTYHGHIFHGYYGRAKTALFVLIERVLAWLCTDRIIVLSPQQRDEICGRFGVGRPDQFQIVPLGIDFSEPVGPDSSLRTEAGAGDADVLVGIVGRLCEVKNQSMFVKAAAALISQDSSRNSSLDSKSSDFIADKLANDDSSSSARFVVIGDGPLRSQLERESDDAGLNGRIIFTGFRKDATSLYRDLDIVALTSVNEGTPLTMIEGLAAGRPVVSTEVGGVVDLMGELQGRAEGFSVWEHGITVPSGDAAAFARALKYLTGAPDLRKQMGEAGRAFVTRRMSKDRLINDIESLYFRMLTREPAASNQKSAAI